MTFAEARSTDPALQAGLVSEIKQAQEATDKAQAKGEQATMDMFQLYANLLPVKKIHLNQDHPQADSI